MNPNDINMESLEYKNRIVTLEDQLKTARNEIANLRQQMRSLKANNEKEYKTVLEKLENWTCSECQQKHENPSGSSSDSSSTDVILKPIGVIRTSFQEKRGTPRQPSISFESCAKLELNNDVFTNPEHSLDGIEQYSHLWIFFYFHKNDSTHVRAKVAPPRLNGQRLGVFATRSPHRPSPIGLSLVRRERIENNCIYFHGVDMVDGTPVLDIKPYIPMYDSPSMGVMNSSISTNNSVASSNVPTFERTSLDGQESDSDIQQYDRDQSLNRDTSRRAQNQSVNRSQSHFGEREAPDGEEDETEASGTTTTGLVTSNPERNSTVEVPGWIADSPAPQLEVTFSESALTRIKQLKGNKWLQTKLIIENVLKADPRSSYLRMRWASQQYTFRIEEINISCKFNDQSHSVNVIEISDNCDNVTPPN